MTGQIAVWIIVGVMGAFVFGCGLLMQRRYNQRPRKSGRVMPFGSIPRRANRPTPKQHQQIDIDKQMELARMIGTPSVDLAALKERILRDIAVYRRSGGYF